MYTKFSISTITQRTLNRETPIPAIPVWIYTGLHLVFWLKVRLKVGTSTQNSNHCSHRIAWECEQMRITFIKIKLKQWGYIRYSVGMRIESWSLKIRFEETKQSSDKVYQQPAPTAERRESDFACWIAALVACSIWHKTKCFN